MKNIDWHLIPDYIRFKRYQKALRLIARQTEAYDARTAIVITGMKIAAAFVTLGVLGLSLGPMFAPAHEETKPLNAPSYDSAPHRLAAAQLCNVETGDAHMVRANSDVVAAHVVVVRQDGVMQRMDTGEAWDRTESKTEADNIWVVGVCTADVVR